MKKSIKFLPLLATGLLAVGCQDYDAGFTEADIKTKQYADKFAQEFGEVDPNQDWSMATLVEANVNLPELQGTAKMNIMTGDPRLASTRLLAQIMLENGKGQIKFDAIKGQDNVFVTVEQDGQYKVFGQYALANGFLGIGDVASNSALAGVTRAFSTPASIDMSAGTNGVVTTGIHYEVFDRQEIKYGQGQKTLEAWYADVRSYVNQYTGSQFFKDETVRHFVIIKGIDWVKSTYELKDDAVVNDNGTITHNNSTMTVEEWKTAIGNDANSLTGIPAGWYSYGPWKNSSYVFIEEDCLPTTNGASYKGLFPEENWELPDNIEYIDITSTQYVKVQYLNDVEKELADPWIRGVGQSIYGSKGFFCEQNYYWGPKQTTFDKTTLYGTTDEEKLETMKSIEAGFKIKAKGDPIEIPMIYAATGNNDQFGYVLYDDDEDPLTAAHYVLMDDARPSTNLHEGVQDADGNWSAGPVGTLSGTNPYYQWMVGYENAMAAKDNSEQDMANYIKMFNTPVYGTTYRLVDFSTGTPSYNIPAGKNIVFFLMKVNKLDHTADINSYTFYYSLPELNERIGNLYGNDNKTAAGGTLTYNAGVNPKGAVKAATWYADGHQYLGFEDGGADEDLNDIIFWVEGNYEKEDPGIVLQPIKWHLNLNKSHDTSDGDIFSVMNYATGTPYTQPDGTPVNGDKRFLGWSTSATATSGSLTISDETPEGGICYFAIWESDDAPSYTIKWHKNTNGIHDQTDGDLHKTDVVEEGGTYTKPSTDPTAPEGKVFVGWALSADAEEPLPASYFENPITPTEDVCYFAIYEDAPAPTPDPEYISWMFACEDLGGTFDYDFNDVVWEVQKTKVGEETTAVKVRLLAAGGTLPFTLSYNSNKICTKEEAFGTSTTPVNAGPRTVSKDVKEYTVSGIGSDWTVSDNYTKFSVAVEVEGTGASTMIKAYQKDETLNNKAPQVILVPGTWQWPTESTPINEAYPQFTKWVENNNYVAWPTPVAGKTVTR